MYTGTVDIEDFAQKSLTISSGIVNAVASTLVVTDGVRNDAELNLTGGGSLGSDITGSGFVNILDSMTNANTITQNYLTIDEDVVLTTSGSVTVNTGLTNNGRITNSGTVAVNGITSNDGVIDGDGTLDLNEDFTNEGTISQGRLDNAKVLTNTNTINVTTTLNNSGTISNDGTLTVGGTNNLGAIEGAGTLKTAGVLTNNVSIEQGSLEILSDSLTSNADTLLISNGIDNSGRLILTGGELTSEVYGSGSTELTGDVVISSLITDNVLDISSRVATLSTDGELNLGGFRANGGALDTRNGQIDHVSMGNVTLQGDMNLRLDADL